MKSSTVLKNTIGTVVGYVHVFLIEIVMLSYISYSTIKHKLPFELFLLSLVLKLCVELFVAPAIGKLSDLTKTFVGRRGPYILFYGLALSFSLSLLQVSLIEKNLKIYVLGLTSFAFSSVFLREMINSFRKDMFFDKVSKISIAKIYYPSYFLMYLLLSFSNPDRLLPILSLINLLVVIFIFFIIYENKKYKSRLFETEPPRNYKATVLEKISVSKEDLRNLFSGESEIFRKLAYVNLILLQVLTPVLFYTVNFEFKLSSLMLALMYLILWLRLSRDTNSVKLRGILLLFLMAFLGLLAISFVPNRLLILIISPVIYILLGYYYAIIVFKYVPSKFDESLSSSEQVLLSFYISVLLLVYILFKIQGTIVMFAITNIVTYILLLRGEEVDKKR